MWSTRRRARPTSSSRCAPQDRRGGRSSPRAPARSAPLVLRRRPARGACRCAASRAFGRLGIILEAHFKVAARPRASGLWAIARPTLASAHRLLLDVAASPLAPVALEAIDVAAAARLRARVPALPDAAALALIGV